MNVGRPATCLLVVAALLAGCAGSQNRPPSASTSGAFASPSPSTDRGTLLQQLIDDARVATTAPGALAVLRLDGREWIATSGTADRAGTPIDRATRFRIASITKPIVAALVVDAARRGELHLDDIVADLLPGVLRATPPVTIRQLLDHTSGIFDEGNEGDPISDVDRLPPGLRHEAAGIVQRYLDGERLIAPPEILVALAETHERYFLPGLGYHYSNVNYQLAGMVLERVTDKPLAVLLAQRIVLPLGLERTTIAPPDLASPELRGYGPSPLDDSVVDLTDDLFAFGNGANGGIISTGAELVTILQAIAAGRFATPELLRQQLTPYLSSYGLGVATYALSCGSFLGHGGGVNGTASIGLVSEDGGDGVVIAFNLRPGADDNLLAIAETALCGR